MKFLSGQFILQVSNLLFVAVFFLNEDFLYFTWNAKFNSCLVKFLHEELVSFIGHFKLFRQSIIFFQINSPFIV